MRALLLLFAFGLAAVAQAPSADVLKQVLQARLLALRPDGMTERQVLFQSVTAGAKNGAYYTFNVTALIRDYGAGYPANRYYGETCVRKMDNWPFSLTRGASGEWVVEGRMTVSDSQCTKNPAAGVSSVPLATLSGSAAPAGAPPAAGVAAELHIGEWACYGTGGRLLAGLGFHLQGDGSYLNGDRQRAGRYVFNKAAGTIAFQGGFLDGQVGRGFRAQSFQLSNTVSCEPWH